MMSINAAVRWSCAPPSIAGISRVKVRDEPRGGEGGVRLGVERDDERVRTTAFGKPLSTKSAYPRLANVRMSSPSRRRRPQRVVEARQPAVVRVGVGGRRRRVVGQPFRAQHAHELAREHGGLHVLGEVEERHAAHAAAVLERLVAARRQPAGAAAARCPRGRCARPSGRAARPARCTARRGCGTAAARRRPPRARRARRRATRAPRRRRRRPRRAAAPARRRRAAAARSRAAAAPRAVAQPPARPASRRRSVFAG